MSEIKTTDKDKLAKYMAENNLEVLNNTQISAILMHHADEIKTYKTILLVLINLLGLDEEQVKQILDEAKKKESSV